jgi:predicted phosphoribosyltransferase
MAAPFRDRVHAGGELAKMLEEFRGTPALVLAIPAGGVPVARAIATELGLPLDVAPVSKVLYPWTTESGYGAVAFAALDAISKLADAVYCTDVRGGVSFAVADAYAEWRDLGDEEIFAHLTGGHESRY